MLIAHHSTAAAITPHAADRSWVVFLQTAFPANVSSPICIVGLHGSEIGRELKRLSASNAYDMQIIGLIATQIDAAEHAAAIAKQYAADHLHDHWYSASPALLAFIAHHGRAALQSLLQQVHPGAINEDIVDIDEMARIIGMSVVTVRRLCASGRIPFMQAGKTRAYRFVPRDVVASLQRHR